MPRRDYVKPFIVDKLDYEMVVTPDYQLVFRLTGGRFKTGEWVLFYEDTFYHNATQYHVTNKVGNPVKVIRTFFALTVEYLAMYRPPYVWFDSSEENRTRVYKRLLTKLPDFCYSITHGEGDSRFLILLKGARQGE
jgi:hypothetical protein